MENKEIYFSGELKQLSDSEEGVFEGYASTFGNVDSTNDIINFGAFSETLKRREPKVLYQHDIKRPVGKLIEAREDERGLYVKVKLAINTTDGRDVYELMKEGIINRLSIGFMVKDSEYNTQEGVRIIKEVDLFEFSLVTIPANDMAIVTGIKTALPQTERDFEKVLRDYGFSRMASKTISAHGFKGYLSERDAGGDIPSDSLRDADDEVKTLLSNILQTLKGSEYVERRDQGTR